jgi:hypothetical protein
MAVLAHDVTLSLLFWQVRLAAGLAYAAPAGELRKVGLPDCNAAICDVGHDSVPNILHAQPKRCFVRF